MEYARLDLGGHIYLDYTGGGLYADSQLRRHHRLLAEHVFGKLHSGNPTSQAATELVVHAPKVVGLGETGLDYHHLPAAEEGGGTAVREALKVKQAEVFRQHLEVAGELGLNCVVHQRDSMADTLALVEATGRGVRCVFHCFTGTVGDLERILATGSLVSYTGIATFKSAHAVREAVAGTPLDRLMLETDCPYLAPVPYRGKRCEPSYVVETAQVVAGVKGCSMEQLKCGDLRDGGGLLSGVNREGRLRLFPLWCWTPAGGTDRL